MTEPSSTEDQPLKRLAVYEQSGSGNVLLATIILAKASDDRWVLQCSAPSQEAIDRLSPWIKQFRGQLLTSSASKAVPDWQGLIDLLVQHGLMAEEIPLGDTQVQIHIDLMTGRAIATQQTMHAFAQPSEEVGRNIVRLVGDSFHKACDDLANKISTAMDNDDLDGAARALEADYQAVCLAGTPALFAALDRMDASKLPSPDKKRLLDARLTTAQRLRRYEAGARDAALVLREEAATLSAKQKSVLNMMVALGEIQKGNRETGLFLLRKLLNGPEDLEAEQRGWAWRNLSLTLDKEDPEARRAAKFSADSFLEAGAKDEASKSLMRLVDLLMYEDADAAVNTLNEITALLDKEGLGDRAVYASMLHARATRLLSLGGIQDAYHDAKAAVEALRGLMGTEEQMVSTLHLAALAAQRVGDREAASQFEAEATKITEEHSLSHFQLARRLVALGEAFDAAEADALLRDAKAADNYDIAASVQIFRANGDTSLDDSARLALLEETFRNFRGKAQVELLDTIKTVIAAHLCRAEEFERAASWLQQALDDDPHNSDVASCLINCLWKLDQWGRAAQVIRKQLDLRGEAPGILYAYAKSLFEAGDADGALTAAQRSIRLITNDSSNTLKAATELRDQALDLGGRVLSARPASIVGPVSRDELEVALKEFARFIAAKKRMTFWYKDKKGERAWTPSPEAHAQNLLHTYLQAKFGDRVDVFEELDTGAGRLDLYVKLEGGLSVVLELKMCGGRYSSNYAASGETQVGHYMDNRKTNIGYLVVFDARITMYGQRLLSALPRHTILELFVDVRPEVV